jgi:hypothetical protein
MHLPDFRIGASCEQLRPIICLMVMLGPIKVGWKSGWDMART